MKTSHAEFITGVMGQLHLKFYTRSSITRLQVIINFSICSDPQPEDVSTRTGWELAPLCLHHTRVGTKRASNMSGKTNITVTAFVFQMRNIVIESRILIKLGDLLSGSLPLYRNLSSLFSPATRSSGSCVNSRPMYAYSAAFGKLQTIH